MCVIVLHDNQGTPVDRDRFDRLWRTNPDGGGVLSLLESGIVRVRKAMNPDSVWKHYEASVDRGDLYTALHLRIATHGPVTRSNVHPFRSGNIWGVHNGTIPVRIPKGDTRSDTRVFIQDYLPNLPAGWEDNRHLTEMVEEYIGWSKMVLLSPDFRNDPVRILNESDGTWEGGTWRSNSNGWHEPYSKWKGTGYATKSNTLAVPSTLAKSDELSAWREIREEISIRFPDIRSYANYIVCEWCDAILNEDRIMSGGCKCMTSDCGSCKLALLDCICYAPDLSRL